MANARRPTATFVTVPTANSNDAAVARRGLVALRAERSNRSKHVAASTALAPPSTAGPRAAPSGGSSAL